MLSLQPVPFDNDIHNLQAYLQQQLSEMVNAVNVQMQVLSQNTAKHAFVATFTGAAVNGACSLSVDCRNVASVTRAGLGLYQIALKESQFGGSVIAGRSAIVLEVQPPTTPGGAIFRFAAFSVLSPTLIGMRLFRVYEHASTFLKAENDDMAGEVIQVFGFNGLYNTPGNRERFA